MLKVNGVKRKTWMPDAEKKMATHTGFEPVLPP